MPAWYLAGLVCNDYHVCAGWGAIFLMFGIRDYVPTRRMFMLQDLHKMAWKRKPRGDSWPLPKSPSKGHAWGDPATMPCPAAHQAFFNTHPYMVLTARPHKLLCSNFRLSIQFQCQKRSEISMDFSDNCSALVKEGKNLRRTKFKTPTVPAPPTCIDREANTNDFAAY